MRLVERLILGKKTNRALTAPLVLGPPTPLVQEVEPCPYCGAKGVKHMYGAIQYACGTFISSMGIRMSSTCQGRTLGEA